MYKVVWKSKALEDVKFFQKNEPRVIKKLRKLEVELKKHPEFGTGKPEELKHELSGYWARRVTQEHRMVYEITDNTVAIIKCRFHYDK